MKPKFIFDLSEVLIAGLVGIEIPLAAFIDLPKDEILRSFAGQLLEDICCGKISEDIYLEQIIHNQNWNISADALKNCIRENFHREIQGTQAVLKRLVQKYDVALLSDHAREWVNYICDIHPFISEFKQTFFSYELGTTKKNLETFQIVLEKMSWYAEDCWLIDDSLQNIATAASVGINGIHFQNAKQLNAELSRAGF
jgi:HAD superfamily hydrolase (TIGR01509 family)